MKPARRGYWADTLHTWGLVVLALLIFAIMSGLPLAFERIWKC